jgi:hypothetical protein
VLSLGGDYLLLFRHARIACDSFKGGLRYEAVWKPRSRSHRWPEQIIESGYAPPLIVDALGRVLLQGNAADCTRAAATGE